MYCTPRTERGGERQKQPGKEKFDSGKKNAMYKIGCVFKVTIPGQGNLAGHSASGSNWPPDLDVHDLDTHTSDQSFPLLCSGLKAQSDWSDPRCFCRWDTKKVCLIGIGKKKRSFTQNMYAYILIYTSVEGGGSFKSQDGEDGNGGEERCGTIYYSY